MPPTLDDRLKAVSAATLTPLVRRALGRERLAVIDWEYVPLSGGFGQTANLYRFRGTAYEPGQLLPWSLVLKVIAAPAGADAESETRRWDREPLAYRSGLLERLPGGLQAPRALEVRELPGEAYWIWLEELEDEFGPHWPLERYQLAARHLGQLNGAYLRQPVPDAGWLSRRWLREWVVARDPRRLVAPEMARLVDPAVLSPAVVERILQLWDDRERFLALIEQQPQTFCHLDAFRRNLFSRRGPDGQTCTLAIDWAFAGLGAPGEDLAALVSASLTFFEVPLSELRALDQLCFAGYLEGLREAGWDADPAAVRFVYAAATALRFGLIKVRVLLDAPHDEGLQRMLEGGFGRPYAEIRAHLAMLLGFTLELADEARALYPVLTQASSARPELLI